MGRRSARGDERVLVVEGEKLIREAVAAGWQAESQFVACGSEPLPDIETVHVLASGVLERVASTKAAQPHIAIFHRPSECRDLLATAGFVVAASEVADPGNLGTMLRSAEAAGAEVFVVSAGTVDLSSPKVVRASAGSIFRLPVVEVESWASLRRSGRSVIATSSHRGVEYTSVDLRRDIVLVLGNEAHGVDAQIAVDEWITIPHVGPAESLNVAMACTVLCFEVARQRRAPSGTVEKS